MNESVQKKDFIVIECIYSLQMCYFVIHSKAVWDFHTVWISDGAFITARLNLFCVFLQHLNDSGKCSIVKRAVAWQDAREGWDRRWGLCHSESSANPIRRANVKRQC